MAIIIQDEIDTRLPTVLRWTLPTANTATEFVLPDFVKKISIRFETNGGFFSFDATDGALLGVHFGTVDADVWLELNLAVREKQNTARGSIFLAPDTNSTVVQVLLEG